MTNLKKFSLIGVPVSIGIFGMIAIFAATSPALNSAWTFAILSSTFTNSSSTTVSGDIWYTTPPASPAILSGNIHMADSLYNQAGLDQASTLANLNSQVCTFNFAPGAIDLATDITHTWAIWVYAPWVYCITWAASIWTAWITLEGTWTYIFRISWALTSADNSNITLSGAASNCDVFWTPTSATTLGANTNFKWIIIDAAGITLWANTTLLWMALAYGWTVTTDTNTITAPICASPASLHIIKNVVGGTSVAWNFNIHVKYPSGTDVIWSPATWIWNLGRNYSLSAWSYNVTEDATSSYTQSFAWDCNASGNITLSAWDNKTCTITNTYVSSWGGGSSVLHRDVCSNWDYSYSYYDNSCWTTPTKSSTGIISSTGTTVITTSTGIITNTGATISTTSDTWVTVQTETVVETLPISAPKVNITSNSKKITHSPVFPNTWFPPKEIK